MKVRSDMLVVHLLCSQITSTEIYRSKENNLAECIVWSADIAAS